MKKTSYLLLGIILGIFSFTQCEKDDICLEGTPGTPKLIIRFFDTNDNSLSKIPEGLFVRAIGSSFTLDSSNSDSIGLPLNATALFSKFEFISEFGTDNENTDTLQFNYTRDDVYINRACGYRGTFIFNSPALNTLNSGNNWVQGYNIIKDTITDETSYHLAVFH